MSAGFLVLLAGDVSLNPGPMKNSSIVCLGCYKVMRRNRPRLFCKLCELNYHLKCVGSDFEVSGCCPQCSVLPTNDISDSKEFHLPPKLDKVLKLRGFKILHQNIQSLRRKTENLPVLFRKPNCSAHLIALRLGLKRT